MYEIEQPRARGLLLHGFANHELLALELMGLTLLRFPDAPTAFRLDVARTLSEEQVHLAATRLVAMRAELVANGGRVPRE